MQTRYRLIQYNPHRNYEIVMSQCSKIPVCAQQEP